MAQTLVGLFPGLEDAQGAVHDLTNAGFMRENIGLLTLGDKNDGSTTGGLIGALIDHGVPEDRAPHYEQGLRHGGSVVTVRTEEDRSADIQAVFTQRRAAEMETAGMSAEALRRAHEELEHLAPGGSEPLRFGDEGQGTQVGENPISEFGGSRQTRP